MKIKIFTFLILAIVLINSACKKAYGPDLNPLVPQPDSINVSLKQTTVTATWNYADNTEITNFVVDLATDADYKNIIGVDTLDATARTVSFDNVGLITEVHFRIKAIGVNIARSSAFAEKALTVESVFLPVDPANVSGTAVTLKWDSPAKGTVTHIVLTPDGGAAMDPVQLNATDVSARSVTISGLSPATTYTAIIYDNDERKGVVTFTTVDTSAKITINSTSTVYASLQDAVDAAVSGDVINLTKGNFDFTDQTVTINNKSLTIQSVSTDKPVITLKTFVLEGNVPNFEVSGVTIISTSKSTDTDYEKHIFGGTYLTSETNIVLENCDFSGAESGLFFTQTVGAASATTPVPGTATISLMVDNCLMHDFGNAGGDFIDFRSGTINKVIFKNSTLWNSARSVFRVDATVTALSGNVFTIENSTFDNCSNGGSFITLKANGLAVAVNKCILSNKASSKNNVVSGTGTSLTFNQDNIFGSNASSLSSVVTTNNSPTALDPGYANAANGDFTVGNSTLKAASVGDPRWLQ